jgi:hypothetical protein
METFYRGVRPVHIEVGKLGTASPKWSDFLSQSALQSVWPEGR